VVAAPSAAVKAPSSDGVDVTLHHLAAGPPERSLLISHATGFHGRAYGPLAEALDGGFDVWAFDHRGHGMTAAPPDWEVSWRGFGDDAAAAALALAGRDGAVGGSLAGFGHSMGGASLLMNAHRHPGLFSLLILFEPIVFPPGVGAGDPETSPIVAAARRRRPWFNSYEEAAANFASKPPMSAFDPAALDAYVRDGLAPADPDDPDGPVQLLCAPDLEADTFARGRDHDTWTLLPEIATPTVIVAGTADADNGPTLLAPMIARQLPDGRYEGHPELDHFGPFTRPADVAAIIRSAATVVSGER
jgi:pimeloyl-ACP methyl ester carboxylesterase